MSNIIKAFIRATAISIGLTAFVLIISFMTFYLPLIWSGGILVMCLFIFVWLMIYLGLENEKSP